MATSNPGPESPSSDPVCAVARAVRAGMAFKIGSDECSREGLLAQSLTGLTHAVSVSVYTPPFSRRTR